MRQNKNATNLASLDYVVDVVHDSISLMLSEVLTELLKIGGRMSLLPLSNASSGTENAFSTCSQFEA